MNIKSLEIYGYGRLQQRKYQLNRSFTQIYGENETGKSTMQLFIHSILFGFPGPDEPKLMPRFATTYGGNLLIEMNGEEIFIERVYRNQKEELTVLYQKQHKDAAWLTQKLNFITKETYRQIFSFDVLSLQHVHQLTEDKLQNYLLQAGVFGSTEYSSLENTLEDEKIKIITDDYESGELYDHVLELTNLEIRIREEENKLQQYDVHQSCAYQLTGKIDLLRSHIEQLTEIQQRKQKEMMFHADMKEWKQLEHQLNIEPVVFPDNGIERYESLKRQNYNNERDIMLRAEKVNQLIKEAGIELMPDDTYRTAQELLKEEPVIKQHEKVLNNLDRDILDKQAAMHAVQTDIGWSRYEDIPLGDLKEQIIYNVAEKERLMSQLEQLRRELEQAKAEEAMTAQEQAELKPHIVSDAQYRNGIQLFAQKEELAQKTELYNKLSAEQKRNAAVDEAKRKKLNIAYSMIALAAAAAAVYCFFSAALIPALVMIVISVIMIILALVNKQPHSYEWNILDEEIAGLENSIVTLSGGLDDSFDLEKQQDYRAQLSALDREQKIHSRKEVQLNKSLEKKQADYNALADELQKIKEQLRLPAQFEDSLLHHAYRAIGKMQQLKAAIDQLKAQYITEQSAIERFRTQLNDSGLVTSHEHLTMAFQELSAIVKSEDKKRTHKLRQDEQLALSERELAAVRTSADELNNEITQLFAAAAVDNEADYYLKFAEYKQYKRDFERHQQLSRKLEDENFTYEMNTELAYTSAEDLRKSEADISDQIHELKEALQKEQFELHHVEQEMAELEQDTTLSELGYQYAIEREIVNRLAKEYGALNYIKMLIASHRQNVKEERIPHIISEASHIFSTLTEGRYIAVTYEEELLVKHKDGQVYHPTELSQSTKELLYIAMRLSLIQHLHQLYPLPIIIDDAFVHFDKQRKDFVIDYLMKKEDNQVLYFTPNRSTNIPGKNTLVLERHDKETK